MTAITAGASSRADRPWDGPSCGPWPKGLGRPGALVRSPELQPALVGQLRHPGGTGTDNETYAVTPDRVTVGLAGVGGYADKQPTVHEQPPGLTSVGDLKRARGDLLEQKGKG
jgi:hypothetical protein